MDSPTSVLCRLRVNGDERDCAVTAGTTLLEALLSQPVVDIESLRVLTGGVADKNIYTAIGRLETTGVLTEMSGGGRNRVWAAVGVLELLERLESELGRRALSPRP